ncbi:HlyD family secretion protein [Labilithrix luteola]|nr:HlyD family secretion protein [Labilithrix luteola]
MNSTDNTSVGNPPDSASQSDTPSSPRKRLPRTAFLRVAVTAAIVTALGVGATRYLRWAERFERTDNAYLEGRVHAVSARVSGTVVEVLTDDNRRANTDEPLVRLDRRDFEVRLDAARTQLASAGAAVVEAQAQIVRSHGEIERASAGIARSRAEQDKASLDIGRAGQLLHDDAIPKIEYDDANAKLEVARANSASATSARAVSIAALRAAEANLKVAEARKVHAEAAVRDAELQLSYTTVSAPTIGRVGKKSVEVGQHVQPGQALLAVVEDEVWVVANFKESQLTKMRPGQTVEISVDAMDGHVFTGTIESFSPGTGARFSLLPPDNATGNFTKIVQRVPVKIRLDAQSVKGFEDRLLPGLSVIATARVRP